MLDSDICIYLLRDLSPALTARIGRQPMGSVCLSSIGLAEVAVGFGERAGHAPDLRAFLAAIPVHDFGQVAARIYGTLPFKRARFDRLIAAHALSLGVVLVTNNAADFADIPGLIVEDWTRP